MVNTVSGFRKYSVIQSVSGSVYYTVLHNTACMTAHPTLYNIYSLHLLGSKHYTVYTYLPSRGVNPTTGADFNNDLS